MLLTRFFFPGLYVYRSVRGAKMRTGVRLATPVTAPLGSGSPAPPAGRRGHLCPELGRLRGRRARSTWLPSLGVYPGAWNLVEKRRLSYYVWQGN